MDGRSHQPIAEAQVLFGTATLAISDEDGRFTVRLEAQMGGDVVLGVQRLGYTPVTVVVRPDSGDPTVIPIQVIEALAERYGFDANAKGYKVLEARTGEAALELLDAVDDHIDLMITDAVMPEMDGPTLIKEMRDSRPDLPVICISGYAEETFREKLGASDDIHFMPKQFSLNQLAGKVKDVMSLPIPS